MRVDGAGAEGTQAGTEREGSADASRRARLCARVACGGAAVATLTSDYEDRVMAVGPLSPDPVPQAHDLCARHRDALSPPRGWSILRYEAGG